MSRKNCVLAVLAIAFVTAAAFGSPQRPRGRGAELPGRPPEDAVAMFQQALSEAGAASLSSAQEEQLRQLIASARENQPQFGGAEQVQAARETYQKAVLSGDFPAVKAAAMILAELQLEVIQARMEDQAAVMIQALAILTPDQVSKLTAQFETGGLFMLLQRLAGPPIGGRGPGAALAPPPPPED